MSIIRYDEDDSGMSPERTRGDAAFAARRSLINLIPTPKGRRNGPNMNPKHERELLDLLDSHFRASAAADSWKPPLPTRGSRSSRWLRIQSLWFCLRTRNSWWRENPSKKFTTQVHTFPAILWERILGPVLRNRAENLDH